MIKQDTQKLFPKVEIFSTLRKFLGKEMIKGKAHYLIKWQGFSDKHNTYEPEENIFNKTLILNFERNHLKKGGGTENHL